MTTSHAPVPDHPRLLPGTGVHRRDATTLQVGLDRPRVLLPDTPDVRRLLDLLSPGRPAGPRAGLVAAGAPADAPARRALRALAAAGLLVDAAQLDRILAGRVPSPAGDGAVAALFCAAPASAPDRLSARRDAVVGLDAAGDHDLLARLLLDSGVGHVVPADGSVEPDLVVLVRSRPPVRDVVDDLMRGARTHLLVVSEGHEEVVGPLVEPGASACLRCVDAHLADRDPRRPVVLEQALAGVVGGPVPRDPVLHHLALAWAVRDVLAWVDGGPASTWSATVRLGPAAQPAHEEWRRHPHCGCAWGTLTA